MGDEFVSSEDANDAYSAFSQGVTRIDIKPFTQHLQSSYFDPENPKYRQMLAEKRMKEAQQLRPEVIDHGHQINDPISGLSRADFEIKAQSAASLRIRIPLEGESYQDDGIGITIWPDKTITKKGKILKVGESNK